MKVTQLFGLKPCEAFVAMTTADFAEKFCATIKAEDDDIPHYTRVLAVMVSILYRRFPDAETF